LDEVSSEKLVAEEKMHLLETVLSERNNSDDVAGITKCTKNQ
jgi:hypothetical protein